MRHAAAFVAGRRTKWVRRAAWLALLVIFAPLGGKVSQITDSRTESFLPKNAESTRVLRIVERDFGGRTASALVVYRHPGGLTGADRSRIAADARRTAAALPVRGRPQVPFAPGAPARLVSPDGAVAYAVMAVPDDNAKLGDWGKRLRGIVARPPAGTTAYVTGAVGLTADLDEVFGSLDVKLLLVTVLLVLVLLGAIHRSPVIALIPLVVVGFAYEVAQGLVYLYGRSGATVSDTW